MVIFLSHVSLPEGNGMNINQQTCHHFTEGYHPAGTTPICESTRGAPPCGSCGDVDNRQGRDQPPSIGGSEKTQGDKKMALFATQKVRKKVQCFTKNIRQGTLRAA